MLEIRINNKTADIQGTTIKMVLNSPAFSSQAIVGDHSYSLSFPDTPNNRKIFKYQNKLESQRIIDLSFKIDIYFYGNKSISGNFVLQKITNAFSGFIQAGSHDFLDKIKDKKTNQINFGTTNFADFLTMKSFMDNAQLYPYPDYNFTWFPVINMSLMDNSPYVFPHDISESESLSEMPEDITAADDWKDAGGFINNDYDPTTLVLFPYFAHVIKTIIETHNLKLIDNFFESHDELKQLVLYSPFRLKKYSGFRYNLSDHVGKYDILDLLNQTRNTFNVAFFTNHNNNHVRLVPLNDLLTNEAIDWTDKLVGLQERLYDIEYTHGVNFGYDFDSSDETLNNFQLKGDNFFETYNFAGYIDTKDELPNYIFPWSTHLNEIWKVRSESLFYVFKPTVLSVSPYTYQKWFPLSYDLFNFKEGEKEFEHLSSMSTLGIHNTNRAEMLTPPASYRLVPRSDQNIANQEGFNTFYNPANPWLSFNDDYFSDVKPRLLFYRGKQIWESGSGFYYPFANFSEFNPSGNQAFTYSLNWEGQSGLYSNYHASWVKFIQKRSFHSFKVKLSYTDILNLDLTKRYKFGSNYFLIKDVKFDIPLSSHAQISAYRINL